MEAKKYFEEIGMLEEFEFVLPLFLNNGAKWTMPAQGKFTCNGKDLYVSMQRFSATRCEPYISDGEYHYFSIADFIENNYQ